MVGNQEALLNIVLAMPAIVGLGIPSHPAPLAPWSSSHFPGIRGNLDPHEQGKVSVPEGPAWVPHPGRLW